MLGRDQSPIIIGSYEVVEIIAPGEYVALCRARHRLTGQEAGLRILRPALSDRADLVHHFVREVRTLARVQHAAVLAFTGLATDNGVPFALTDPLAGRTLAQLQANRETPLPVPAALAMLYQVVQAVAAIHADGQVHGALDPTCVLLAPDGSAVLLPHRGIRDEHGRPLLLTADALGSPDFQPPERAPGSAPDAAGDVYALGELARLIMPRAEIPEALAALFDRCVAARPEERPALAELADAIGAASREPEPDAAPVSPAPSAMLAPAAAGAPRPLHRRRWVMGALAVAATAAAVIVIAAGNASRGNAGAVAATGPALNGAVPVTDSGVTAASAVPSAPAATGGAPAPTGAATPIAPTAAPPAPTPVATPAPAPPASPRLPLVSRLTDDDAGPIAELPVDLFGDERTRAVVAAVNSANRVFIAAEASADAGLLMQCYGGPVLEEFSAGVRQLRQAGRRRLGSLREIELSELEVDGDRASLHTRERWRLETLAGDRRVSLITRWYEQRYELHFIDGRWLIVQDDILAESDG